LREHPDVLGAGSRYQRREGKGAGNDGNRDAAGGGSAFPDLLQQVPVASFGRVAIVTMKAPLDTNPPGRPRTYNFVARFEGRGVETGRGACGSLKGGSVYEAVARSSIAAEGTGGDPACA
jgi:hypothetical protein